MFSHVYHNLAALRETPAARHPKLAAAYGQLLASYITCTDIPEAKQAYQSAAEDVLYADDGEMTTGSMIPARTFLHSMVGILNLNAGPVPVGEAMREAFEDYKSNLRDLERLQAHPGFNVRL